MNQHMKNLLALLGCLMAASLSAQKNYGRDQNKMLDDAELLFGAEEFAQAALLYKRLLPVDTTYAEVYYKMGVCEVRTPGKWEGAVGYLERAVRNGHVEAHYELAQCRHRQQRFDQAIDLYGRYKQLEYRAVTDADVDRYMAMSRTAKIMTSAPKPMTILDLGQEVNTKWHDYAPLVTADRSKMWFTSRRSGTTGGLQDPNGQWFEDIYVTNFQNGKWFKAANAKEPLNTPVMDATVGLSQDGTQMIIYRSDADLDGGDLYLCSKEAGTWGSPELLSDRINSDYFEPSASLGENGGVIYFTSDRPGGFGGRDLYRVRRLPNGEWSLPMNLGAAVNTPYDEDAPFAHGDGRTLFFSSNGHNTMGGYDIFKSVLMEEEGNSWSVPENMGYPLNTVNDDIYFCLTDDGTTGFFSSERGGGLGGQDIYTVSFPVNQLEYVVVRGVVTNGLDEPVAARISLMNNGTGDLHGIYKVNERTGRYIMIVRPGERYQMQVEAEGFEPYMNDLALASSPDGMHLLDLRMVPLASTAKTK
jgi:WD40-like Beta Propeller Repeat/Tetratricopeptide repeat